MSECKFASSADAKRAHYYSRRNESPAAQAEARRNWEQKSSRNRAKVQRKRGVS